MIVYRKARTKADLDEIYRLRFRVLCQERQVDGDARSTAGKDEDIFDQYSIQIMARHFDLVPVGTIRLVRPNPLGFPVENFHGAHIQQKEQAAEVSKLAISRLSLRLAGTTEQEVLCGLFRTLCRESKHLGIDRWYCMLSPGMHRLFVRRGLRPLPVNGRPSGNETPHVIELRQLEAVLFAHDPFSTSPPPPFVGHTGGKSRSSRTTSRVPFH